MKTYHVLFDLYFHQPNLGVFIKLINLIQIFKTTAIQARNNIQVKQNRIFNYSLVRNII